MKTLHIQVGPNRKTLTKEGSKKQIHLNTWLKPSKIKREARTQSQNGLKDERERQR